MLTSTDSVIILIQQASRFEQIVKDKEAKFKEEQQTTTRRAALNDSIRKWQEDDKKVIVLQLIASSHSEPTNICLVAH